MPLWLNRCGSHGEFETKFVDDGRIYLTWGGLDRDLRLAGDRDQIRDVLAEVYPDAGERTRINHAAQINAFVHRMRPDDWCIVPTKRRSFHVGKITGDYVHDPGASDPFFHHRTVEWLETDIPRTNFDQDLLNSLGAIMTICQIRKHDAEARVRAMRDNDWKSVGIALAPGAAARATRLASGPGLDPGAEDADIEADTAPEDLEQLARDQIARTLYAEYKGYGMEALVGAILRAQGFTVHSPDRGPDGGVDLLAAPGTLGFGSPRICVQVKSQDTPLDRPTLDQLLGTMSNVSAEQGLLVCWGGFKKTVKDVIAQNFFRVRLWDQNDLLDQFLAHYDRFDDDLKAAVPLKRVWAVASGDGTGER